MTPRFAFGRALLVAALFGASLIAPVSNSAAQTVATPTPTPTVDPAVPTATPAATPTPFVSGVPCARDDPHSPGGVRRSDRHGNDQNGEDDDDEFRSGNGRNVDIVHNCTDERLRVVASVQLNRIPGHVVRPLNEAYAEGSCVHCQTLAVALQVDLYSAERANDVRPENYAVALNTGCTGCFTVARAIQYVQPIDDPDDVPEGISRTVNGLERELRSIQVDPDITLEQAEARLNAVLDEFNQLGGSLGEQRDERDD